jgi:hypothetical protein
MSMTAVVYANSYRRYGSIFARYLFKPARGNAQEQTVSNARVSTIGRADILTRLTLKPFRGENRRCVGSETEATLLAAVPASCGE